MIGLRLGIGNGSDQAGVRPLQIAPWGNLPRQTHGRTNSRSRVIRMTTNRGSAKTVLWMIMIGAAAAGAAFFYFKSKRGATAAETVE